MKTVSISVLLRCISAGNFRRDVGILKLFKTERKFWPICGNKLKCNKYSENVRYRFKIIN